LFDLPKAQKTYDQVRKETIKNIKMTQPKMRSISMNSINSEPSQNGNNNMVAPPEEVNDEDDEDDDDDDDDDDDEEN
jgi:hypothetical protein